MVNLWKIVSGSIDIGMLVYILLVLMPRFPAEIPISGTLLLYGGISFLVFFLSFVAGVILTDYWESIVALRGLIVANYLVIISGTLILNESLLVTTVGLFSYFGLYAIWSGYVGSYRFRRNNQPFQKYEYVPADVLEFPLIPYYYFKQRRETDTTESENDEG
jgi:hypothetical protein